MTSLSFMSPTRKPSSQAPSWQYVYGVIRAEHPQRLALAGVDGATMITTVGEGGLAVITSPIARPNLYSLERAELLQYLGAHRGVIEALRQNFPVLPARFGTILPGQGQLLALLRSGAPVLEQALEVYADKRQFEVQVLWDLGRELDLRAARALLPMRRPPFAARSLEGRRTLHASWGQLHHAALEQRRDHLARDLTAQLHAIADDLIVNPPMSDTLVANITLLISDERQEALDDLLDTLSLHYGGRLEFRCVGPLPPYSFATLEVQTPSFEAVDLARQTLGLAEATDYATLKRVYRALAARQHPHQHRYDDAASAYIESLAKAYRLLTTVALAQAAGSTTDAWPCRFDRAAVAETLLLTITRLKAAAPPPSVCKL